MIRVLCESLHRHLVYTKMTTIYLVFTGNSHQGVPAAAVASAADPDRRVREAALQAL